MTNYQYIKQNERSNNWVNISINRIHQKILAGLLDEAEALNQKILASEQLTTFERADFLYLQGIIFTKKYDYLGEKKFLVKAKNFTNEAIEQLGNVALMEKKVKYYLHLAVIFIYSLEFVRAHHLLKKVVEELVGIEDTELPVRTYLTLAKLFLKQDDYDKALTHILTAFRHTESRNNPILLIDV